MDIILRHISFGACCRLLPALLFVATASTVRAQSVTSSPEEPSVRKDSVVIYFPQGVGELNPSFQGNARRLRDFSNWFNTLMRKDKMKVKEIRIASSASPEGSIAINERLSQKRATSIVNYMDREYQLSPTLFDIRWLGIDWSGLATLVAKAPSFPNRTETLRLLSFAPPFGSTEESDTYRFKSKLQRIGNGAAWRYMEKQLFPELRKTMMYVVFEGEPIPATAILPKLDTLLITKVDTVELVRVDTLLVQPPLPESKPKPFYMSLRSNLISTVALVPNIGVEFYLSNGFSVRGSWSASWWKNDNVHFYWRIYGGELEFRRYFGRLAQEKPLQGHHLGLYTQWYSWDFELGKWNRGYQSANGTWGLGLSYGYMLPIGRRFNLDFEVGLGHMQGHYQECLPQIYSNKLYYVWQSTRRFHYFGPTRVGITLTWLLGNGNYNDNK